MLRTKLRNRFSKKRILEPRTIAEEYSYQYCQKSQAKLLRKFRFKRHINDNRKFWATAKPLFFNKIKSVENIL